MAVTVEFLQSVPYFSGLSVAELDSIMEFIFEKTLQRGELVLIEEEPAEVLYFVASGAVKVFKTSAEGKEQILNIVRPGESFNDVSIFDGGPNPASVQTMGPVVLYGIRRSDLEIILRDHPQVALNVTKVLAGQARHLGSLVEDLSFRHVIGRVAKILLEHAGDGTGARPRLTQQDMAAMAGTVREVVGRSLKALEDDGAIRLERHRIVITDKEALKDMVAAYF
ncbi:MAG: Crp/Fnr family transcriptional regulator [Dehalococcoidia bacterium]|nr:MAG: Crp/Fnr family transcriptional regulator [Dehalococcoidia bacterium]